LILIADASLLVGLAVLRAGTLDGGVWIALLAAALLTATSFAVTRDAAASRAPSGGRTFVLGARAP
jgi:hypothetical protein